MGKSRAALDKAIPGVLERLTDRLPAMLIESLREQWNDLQNLDRQIAEIERRLRRMAAGRRGVQEELRRFRASGS
jgi:transposase